MSTQPRSRTTLSHKSSFLRKARFLKPFEPTLRNHTAGGGSFEIDELGVHDASMRAVGYDLAKVALPRR